MFKDPNPLPLTTLTVETSKSQHYHILLEAPDGACNLHGCDSSDDVLPATLAPVWENRSFLLESWLERTLGGCDWGNNINILSFSALSSRSEGVKKLMRWHRHWTAWSSGLSERWPTIARRNASAARMAIVGVV